jgi:type II secretory pathway pseudopilin PulG
MKNQEKQEFKSSGVLTLLGLVGTSALIIATPWNQETQISRSENALQKAEVVGYQVVQIYREASRSQGVFLDKSSKDRMPASAAPAEPLRTTGTMGTDPWGQPYHYRILSASDAPKVRILVWSTGPNRKIETTELEDEDQQLQQPSYAGDDLGVILSVTQN